MNAFAILFSNKATLIWISIAFNIWKAGNVPSRGIWHVWIPGLVSLIPISALCKFSKRCRAGESSSSTLTVHQLSAKGASLSDGCWVTAGRRQKRAGGGRGGGRSYKQSVRWKMWKEQHLHHRVCSLERLNGEEDLKLRESIRSP